MDTDINRATVLGVPTLVARGLRRCGEQIAQARRMPHRTHADNAQRCARLAVLAERESRWFGVLHRWVYSPDGTVPLVFGPAVIKAEASVVSDAKFWAETAGYYRCRLAGMGHDEADVRAWSA